MDTLKVFIAEQDIEARDSDSYRKWLLGLTGKGLRSGAQLQVFPPWSGLQVLLYRNPQVKKWPDLAKLPEPEVRACHDLTLEICSSVCVSAGIYMVPGTFLRPSSWQGKWEHCTYLLDPQGNIPGGQSQTHLSPGADISGLAPGNELFVIDTSFGKIGFLIDEDAWYPEISRILALKGVRLVVALVARNKPYSRWQQLAGLWQEVQQNQFFGIESGLNCHLLGVEFESRAAVMGPCEITSGNTGYVTREESPVIGELDFRELERIRREYPLLKFLNRKLYEKWLPDLYAGHRR